MQNQTEFTSKKSWEAPVLLVLDVRETRSSDDLWQFTPEGDFFKRTLMVDS